MTKIAKPSTQLAVRVLSPAEYPADITSAPAPGLYKPDVRFAATHPLGLYWVEHHGAGHLVAYFRPKRKRSRPQLVGSASNMGVALSRISDHEDEMVNPDAPREDGRNGPVSIFSLGKRTSGKKTPTQLDREIEAYLTSQDK